MQRRHLREEGGNQTQQKRAFPLPYGSSAPLPYPSPPLKPAFAVCLNFLFVSYIEYCLVPFTAAPLICGLPFTYQVSAVCFALALRWGLVIVRHKLNNSALSGLPKTFALLLFIAVRFFPIFYTNIQTPPPLQPKRGRCYYHISFRKPLFAASTVAFASLCIIICAYLFGIFGCKDRSAYDYLAVGSFLFNKLNGIRH